MDWKQYASVAALLVSIGSCSASLSMSRHTAITAIRPVLVFHFDLKNGWAIQNVGNGPALDLLVAMKTKDSVAWSHPLRVPPLAKDGEFGLLKWNVYVSARTLGVTYRDIQGRAYSTTCTNDRSSVHDGYSLRSWPDEEITRHWQ